ncbi:hypothetical protein EH11_01040 [Bacillus subtilis]|nr:hypothetical protein EH11_01040 [Bacillus subtilis]RUS10307.1 hypothetical protein EFW59_01039 [Bacillus subtilis]
MRFVLYAIKRRLDSLVSAVSHPMLALQRLQKFSIMLKR